MANKKPITDEIASVEKDIFRDYIGRTLLNPDKVLKTESGSLGIELYSDLLRDPKVGSALHTRRLAITGKEWDVTPASEKRQDVKIADYVKEVLKAINLDAYRRSALSGLVLGFKPCEIMWDYSEGDIFISKIIPRASRRFVFDLQNKLRLLTLANMVEGEELPDRKFQVFTNPSDDGSPYGDGLGRMLYWPVWFKKNAIKFWMIFADKFGSPTAIGKYPPGTTADQQQALLDAIEAIQQESAIKIPDTMLIELLEATRAGTTETYEGLCDFMDSQIAQVMLGHTGTSESTPGKLGSEDAGEMVFDNYIKSDADLLCESENNQMVRWIVDYNFPVVLRNGYPKVWIRTQPEEDLKPLADRDKVLAVDVGLPMAKSYFYDTYGIPQPEEGEELIQIPQPMQDARYMMQDNPPLSPLDLKGESSNKGAGFSEKYFTEPIDWVDRYMEAMSPSLAGVQQNALDKIEEWLKGLKYPPSKDEFMSKVESSLISSYALGIDKAAIAEAVGNIYSWYKLTDKFAPSLDIGFGGSDVRSVNFLSNLDNLYISKYINNPDAINQVRDFIGDQYLQRGGGLFGRGSLKDIQEFRNLFSQKLNDLSDWQIRRIMDTSVQRVRNWAHTSQLHDAGIPEIMIFEPTQKCDFCKQMHGKVIQVRNAYRSMEQQREMTPEQYESFIRENQATITNIESFVDRGILPPYHPHCHGRIIKRIAYAD